MRVAVIASMKKGLDHFVYRELSLFAKQGAAISLFPTKCAPGLYVAREDWRLHRWTPGAVVLMQAVFFLQSPLRYLALLIEAARTKAWVDFFLAWYFARNMKDADVIYATFADRKLYIGYFCKRILDKPLVVMIHAYELYHNPNPRLFLPALQACDQIATVTEYNRELLGKKYGVDSGRVEVVRISVDTEDFRPSTKFVLLIVGFFAERKGHEILFKAIQELQQDDIEVWVVGDEGGEVSVDVRGMAVELGIGPQVAFFGKLSGNALKALYRESDVFCLPCRHDHTGLAEGFPTVLAEAMAFGKPIITTRHVEIPRVIKEIVVDENDVSGLAEAIRELYLSAERREKLGIENRRVAEQEFSGANALKTLNILERVARNDENSLAEVSAGLVADRLGGSSGR
jgi:glycosyltransferase involved in cell wall biosynthesis